MISLLQPFTTPHRPADFAAALLPRAARERRPVTPTVAAPSAATTDVATHVSFARSAVTVEVEPSRSILDAAEAVGLTPRFGCRRGVCHTCTTPLRSGTVRDLRDDRCTDAGGNVRICVSAPATDVVVDL